MDKYRLKEDLQILDKTILKKESEISFDENNEFKISTEYGPITFTPEILKDKLEKPEITLCHNCHACHNNTV